MDVSTGIFDILYQVAITVPGAALLTLVLGTVKILLEKAQVRLLLLL